MPRGSQDHATHLATRVLREHPRTTVLGRFYDVTVENEVKNYGIKSATAYDIKDALNTSVVGVCGCNPSGSIYRIGLFIEKAYSVISRGFTPAKSGANRYSGSACVQLKLLLS